MMVAEWGMSEKLGARTYGDSNASPVFLGRDYGAADKSYSDSTASVIDDEIRGLVDEAHGRAMKLLTDNRDILERVAAALIERETIDSVDLEKLMRGEPLPEMERNDPAPPPVPGSEETAEKKRKEPRLFGKPILDRPKEIPG